MLRIVTEESPMEFQSRRKEGPTAHGAKKETISTHFLKGW